MTKWHRISINLTEKDYRTLKLLAGIKAQSVTHFMRYLLCLHIKANGALIRDVESLKDEDISKFIESYRELEDRGVVASIGGFSNKDFELKEVNEV